MTELSPSNNRPRRRLGDETLDRITVRRSLAPIVDRIAQLQAQAAILRACSARSQDRALWHARRARLCQDLAGIIHDFEDSISRLPARQQANGRVVDLDRSIQSLLKGLSQEPH